MIETVRNCVGCQQGCIHCGRNKNRRVCVCYCYRQEIDGEVYGLPDDSEDKDYCEICLHDL